MSFGILGDVNEPIFVQIVGISLWLKINFGRQIEKGFRFVEMFLTVTPLLKLLAKVIIKFLYEAITADRNSTTFPIIV